MFPSGDMNMIMAAASSQGSSHPPSHPVTSSDACLSIVHSLMCHRQSGDDEAFAKRAIEGLVKKLKDKRDELDALITAVTSAGSQPTKCVTIQRTLDGRLQVAGRKGFPHVVYTRIWRWPDLHKNELKHLKYCTYAFDLKMESVCVNPYHYERVVTSAIDLSNLSLTSSMDGMGSTCNSEYGQREDNGASPSSQSMGPVSSRVHHHSGGAGTAPTTRIGHSSGPQIPLPSPSGSNGGGTAWPTSTSSHQLSHANVPWRPGLSGPSGCPPSPIALTGMMVGGHATPSGSSSMLSSLPGFPLGQNPQIPPQRMPSTPTNSQSGAVASLTTQRPPEYWCTITYFEMDQQVGELFKVSSQHPKVTIDGYTDPSSPNRFCLGQLSNVHRSDASEKARLYIGKGVELHNVGEGDVWIRCISEFSVFVESYYLDREAGRAPGDATHKIYTGAYIKVFDICQCHHQMKQLSSFAQSEAASRHATTTSSGLPAQPPAPGAIGALGIGVDDLRKLCMLRLSFVKGWGPDYPRNSIKETPCWVEIQLHRPLQLLDEVLQSMPLQDIKPSNMFYQNYPIE